MWLPTPIYERVPQFYVLVGLLLITDGLYLGFEISYSLYYLGVGIASCAWGVGIFIMRMKNRQSQPAAQTASGVVDSAAVAEESTTSSEAFASENSREQSVQH